MKFLYLTTVLIIVFLSSCKNDVNNVDSIQSHMSGDTLVKTSYYKSGVVKSITKSIEGIKTGENTYYYDDQNTIIESIIQYGNDTVISATYFGESGFILLQTELSDKSIVIDNLRTKEDSVLLTLKLIDPQFEYGSVLLDEQLFKPRFDDLFKEIIPGIDHQVDVKYPKTINYLSGVMFDQKVVFRTDTTGYFQGTHTYFNLPVYGNDSNGIK